MRTYILQSGCENGLNIYHSDLYRLSSEDEVEGVGLLEALSDQQGIVFIEWPEKMGRFLPKCRFDIHIKVRDSDRREIIIEKIIN
jgi:tRNA threonylcarbamoyl adenosine modification protein YjeE